eukprot:2005915-Amphidinium_carterae.1
MSFSTGSGLCTIDANGCPCPSVWVQDCAQCPHDVSHAGVYPCPSVWVQDCELRWGLPMSFST